MVRLVTLPPSAFAQSLPTLINIYVAAMSYAPSTAQARAPLWLQHSRRAGFRCVAAVDDSLAKSPDGPLIAMSYGYIGARGQWWYDEVSRGVAQRSGRSVAPGMPRYDEPPLRDFFELTELHVRPGRQGQGLGERLLRALVEPVSQPEVWLSTPEGESRAWRLYRRLGFTDVLRAFLFTGDGRPFAVLRRSLPLDSPHLGNG